jgi:fatty acid desaturase
MTVSAAVSSAAPARSSDFTELRRLVRAAGLLSPRPLAFARSATCVVGGFTACWLVFSLVGSSWWQLLVAAALGVFATHFGFLGHDAGHHQVFRGRGAQVVGLLAGDLAIGLSFGWWNDTHWAHHAYPTDAERHPDVGAGALVFDPSQTGPRTGVGRFVTRWQGVLFLPLLLLEGLNLQIASLRASFSRARDGRPLELVLLLCHHTAYLLVLLLFLPLGQALAFLAVQKAAFGLYLGLSFAPNHKGMPLLTEAERGDHLRTQVLTARNVRPGRVVDVLLGGLNYQIEHHLFPMMPRQSLRAAQPIVRDFCERVGVRYCETSLLTSYGQALKHLHEVGASLRQPALAD